MSTVRTPRFRSLKYLLLSLPLCLGVSSPPSLSLAGEPARIQSTVLQNSQLQLKLATTWDRRYRIESSHDLTTWKTVQTTDPASGTSLTVRLTASGDSTAFFRASTFEWEELHAFWQTARERWSAQKIATYQFEFRWICHCVFVGWTRVEVQNGVIVNVIAIDTGESLPRDQWSTYLTIDKLFDWIESRRNLHPADLRAVFDPTRGFPQSGYCDISRQIADEELGFELRSLTY